MTVIKVTSAMIIVILLLPKWFLMNSLFHMLVESGKYKMNELNKVLLKGDQSKILAQNCKQNDMMMQQDECILWKQTFLKIIMAFGSN